VAANPSGNFTGSIPPEEGPTGHNFVFTMPRSRTMRLFCALFLFAAGATLSAADESKTAATARATGLTIRKPLPPKKKEMFAFNPAGTGLDVTITAPGKFILGIDAKASKLDHFTDDKKTKFDSGGGIGGMTWLSDYAQITPDGEQCTVQLSARTPPTKEANKVLVKATVVLKCGAEEKTTEMKKIAMKLNTEVAIGSYTVKVLGEGSNFSGGQVEILSETPDIKKADFFDPSGKAIEITTPPFRGNSFTPAGKMKQSISYFLPKKMDAVSVQITYFSKVEAVSVPFDLSVGVGLD
jgi:hypothetical protein